MCARVRAHSPPFKILETGSEKVYADHLEGDRGTVMMKDQVSTLAAVGCLSRGTEALRGVGPLSPFLLPSSSPSPAVAQG